MALKWNEYWSVLLRLGALGAMWPMVQVKLKQVVQGDEELLEFYSIIKSIMKDVRD